MTRSATSNAAWSCWNGCSIPGRSIAALPIGKRNWRICSPPQAASPVLKTIGWKCRGSGAADKSGNMKTKIRPPELLEAIAAHARAVLAGNIETAERYVVPGALGTYRTAFAEAARLGPFDAYAAPGLARLGT